METTANFPGVKPFLSIQSTITLVQVPIIFLLEFCEGILSDYFSCVLDPLCSIFRTYSVIFAKYKIHLLPFLLKIPQCLPGGFRIETKLLCFSKALLFFCFQSLSVFPKPFQSLRSPCPWVPVTLSLSHSLSQPSPTSHSPAHPSTSTHASLSSSLAVLG